MLHARSAQYSDFLATFPTTPVIFNPGLTFLKQDRREIFHAAAEAQRIADYILGFHPDHATQPSEPVEDEDEARLNPPLAA